MHALAFLVVILSAAKNLLLAREARPFFNPQL
jgi:hypothetical protein